MAEWVGEGLARKEIAYRFYQEKVAHALEARIALLEPVVDERHDSVLDVGTNLGDVAVLVAKRGRFVVGVDEDANAIASARARYGQQPHLAFATFELTPTSVTSLPEFGTTLLLSVYHNWVRAWGDEVARRMLRTLFDRCETLVFEGPSRSIRYGRTFDGFSSNDPESVIEWYRKMLEGTLGAAGASISLLGRAPCLGEREPYRWMWVARRSGSGDDM